MSLLLFGAAQLLLVRSLWPVAPLGLRPLDAVWVGELRGHPTVVVLRERLDGRVTGVLPGEPEVWVSGGRRIGRHVTIDLAADDGLHAWTGMFAGSVGGGTLVGEVTYSDLGLQAVRLERSRLPAAVEHWVAGVAGEGPYRLVKVLDGDGRFLAGGYLKNDECGFLACSGTISSWTVEGLVHSVAAIGSPDCPSATTLSGTWDPGQLMVQGSWSRAALACRPAAAGDFLAGEEGLTPAGDLADVLSMLRDFADDIEAESPDVTRAFAATYLNDGATPADWQTTFATLYSGYHDLEASVSGIGQVVTVVGVEVNPRILLPPRIEWRLTVTGIPEAGGTRRVVLERNARMTGDEDLFWIRRDGGLIAFTGNGSAAPFSVDLPMASGDQSYANHGIWPFGVHGGGHPEGHPGIDFEYQPGASIRASAPGTIDRIEPDEESPGQSRLRMQHRSGFSTWNDGIAALAPGVAAGATVTPGQALGAVGDSGSGGFHIYMTHFAVRRWDVDECPTLYLSAAGSALFDTIWPNAAYAEELTEPFPCNPVAVTFPLTRVWTRTSGTLPQRIAFIRLDPHTSEYRYALRSAAGVLLESGTVSQLNPATGPNGGLIDLKPDVGAVRLGRYRIISSQMQMAWGATRPANLGGASVYTTAP